MDLLVLQVKNKTTAFELITAVFLQELAFGEHCIFVQCVVVYLESLIKQV